MQTTHGMKFGSPIRSMALSSDNKKLVVGLLNGDLVIRSKKDMSSAAGSLGNVTSLSSDNTQQVRLYKGAGATVSAKSDNMVETERMVKLRPYEVHLKKFNYQQALDASLKTRNPLVVVTVLEELSRRSGLSIALSGRDESTLVDLYCGVLGQSDAIDELFHKLRQQVKAEVTFHREIVRVVGSLDEIISASEMTRVSDTTVQESST